MGAASGDAFFADETWSGSSGDVTRHAALGQAQIGAVARLGYHYVPTLRIGIGFQGANHGTRFTPDGAGAMPGPDGGFEVDAFFSFGVGFEVRLGSRWHAGISGAFARSFEGSTRSLDTSLHLSYSWKPGRSDEL